MRIPRLSSVRGQLIVSFVGVMAALLLLVGVVQNSLLGSYVRSTTGASMRQSAYSELQVLGPCFIQSQSALSSHALILARLLGSPFVGVKIVTPAGQVLADHSFGPPGSTHPLRLSAATIRRLIRSARSSAPAPDPETAAPCKSLTAESDRRAFLHGGHAPFYTSEINQSNVLLMAVPLGPPGHTLGYALLGRSLATESDILTRARLVFLIAALLALLLTALLAWPIVNRALRPLKSVAQTAQAIAGGDLQQRTSMTSYSDEVGRLSEAFDTMVDRLEGALAQATASEARMRRFLADASHELRTPLTVLRGTSQILLRQSRDLTPDTRTALQDIHDESVRVSRLVDDLLTLSRLDSGSQALRPEPVGVAPFLHRFLDKYGAAWPQREVVIAGDNPGPATILVDPDALTRVLTNLIDNAHRYSRRAGRIWVEASCGVETVEIRVVDEGPGFDPKDAERVFDRFYQRSEGRSRRQGGAGLGLSIVQALVEGSGGHVRIETGPERGTTVCMTFPRLEEVKVRAS